MIDPNKAVKAFEKKFCSMSYSEQARYLKEMGFSFEQSEFEQDKPAKKVPRPRATARRLSPASYRHCKEV